MPLRTLSRLSSLMCVPVALFGQLTRGFISGTVQDPTQAVIADVKISITNVDTGISRDTITNNAGVYRFVAVEPGVYDLELVAPRTQRCERIDPRVIRRLSAEFVRVEIG